MQLGLDHTEIIELAWVLTEVKPRRLKIGLVNLRR